MKIRSLRLEQFKKFDQPVRIDGFADGLNLLAGPNEMGKSTLLLALRAALFERHSAKTQAIKGFQPNHIKGSAPTVSVDFEVDRKVYHLEKRFLRRPMARLVLPDGQIREGHDGEAAIRALLRLDGDEHIALDKGSPGHFGVMFTPQSHAFHQPSLAESTRHSLQEAITAEIEQLGNQSEVDAVLANVDAAVFEIVDRRGKPKGRYRDVELRLAETEADVAELRRDRDDLAEDVSALNVAEAGLHDLEHEQGDQDLEVVLHRLEAKRGDLVRDQAIEARCSAAQHRLDSLLLRRQQRRKLNQDHQKLGADSEHLAGEAADLNKRLSALDGDLQAQQMQLRSFEERGEGFQQKRRRLERLNDHINRRDEIENALQAMATEVTIELDSTALDRVRLDGTPIDRSSQVVQVTEGLAIDIVDVGQIKILPKIEAMRDLREKRGDLHRSITELMETIGVEGLDEGAMEAVWQELIDAESSLRTGHGACEDRVQALSQNIGDLKTTLHGVVAKRQQIEGRLAEIAGEIGEARADGAEADSALDGEIADAEAERLAAQNQAKGSPEVETEPRESRQSLDELEAEIKALRERIDQRVRLINEAKLKIERLGTKVAMRAGRGLDERLEDGRRRREMLCREQAAYQLDAKALNLLTSALTEAANEAKARFHTPLTDRLSPYVQALLPSAAPEVTPDFGITALHRDGVADQRFEQLSDGTREQIAVLARLAFADMLREQGLPALVILDDALAFSDEQRLERVFDILEEAATRMQIIIFTCREDRFDTLNAKRLMIEASEASPIAATR